MLRNGLLARMALAAPALAGGVFMVSAGSAQATTLQAGPDAPGWAHAAATGLLVLHITGGAVGILAGATALLTRKGDQIHRAAGNLFFASMFIAYAIGGGVAPFLTDGQRPNFVAGVLALYLLISGWMTVKRPETKASAWHVVGLVAALLIAGMGALFIYLGSISPTGTVDGSPSQAFVLFATAGTFAAAGELNVLLRRQIAGAARIARHLWRMCFSLFIAAGSFFLGQQQVMPEWIRGSTILFVLAFAPLAAMVFWVVRVRIGRRFKDAD